MPARRARRFRMAARRLAATTPALVAAARNIRSVTEPNLKASLTIAIVSLLPALAQCAILPDTIGVWKRGDVVAAPAPDVKVWNEYGLQESETAPYTDA